MIYLLAIITIFFYASLGVIAKHGLQHIPSFIFISITMYMLATFSLVAGVIQNQGNLSLIFQHFHTSWKVLLLFGVVNFVGFALYTYVLKNMPVAYYQLLAVMTPIFGSILAYHFLGENLPKNFYFAIIFFVIGVYLIFQPH